MNEDEKLIADARDVIKRLLKREKELSQSTEKEQGDKK